MKNVISLFVSLVLGVVIAYAIVSTVMLNLDFTTWGKTQWISASIISLIATIILFIVLLLDGIDMDNYTFNPYKEDW